MPEEKVAVQVEPQAIPAGSDVTVPPPLLTTVSVCVGEVPEEVVLRLELLHPLHAARMETANSTVKRTRARSFKLAAVRFGIYFSCGIYFLDFDRAVKRAA